MFSESILEMIRLYQGKFVVINRHTPVCICAKNTSGEADPACIYCFGTGKQVTVKEVYGVVQESNGASTMRKAADYTITKEIFVDAKYNLETEDLIIFENQVYKTYQIKTFRLTDNNPVYRIIYATPLKYNSAHIIERLASLGVIK